MNQNGIIIGKLNGVMAATTPRGWRIIISSMPGAMSSLLTPCIIDGIPHATSTFSMDRRISATLSVKVFPHSSVMVRARSLMLSSSSVFSLNNGWMRSPAGLRRHSRKAISADCAARSTSCAGDSGTSANTSADAGFRTFKTSVAWEATHPPSTKFSRRSFVKCAITGDVAPCSKQGA